jgi:hypothetical protein
VTARRGEPVFGADEPGSRRLPLAPRSRSVGARSPSPASDHVQRVGVRDGGDPIVVARAPADDPGVAGENDAEARRDDATEAQTPAAATRRVATRLALDVAMDEMPLLVRGGKANQVRSSALATRVLEEAVGALKQRGHGDASKQSVQEMLLLALRGLDAETLVGLHKQYRTLIQDAREADAVSQLS